MSKIAITDYFEFAEEEKEILGDLVGTEINDDTEILLVWHEQINEQFIKNIPKLKGVQRYGVGYDTLDLNFLKSRNIICCNNPDYGIDEVSDTAVAMILNISRGIFQYNHNAKKYFNNWQENVNKKLKRSSETNIGIIGAGRIGGSVILKCNSMKFNTYFYDPYKESGYEKMLNSRRVNSIDELLNVSDIISIHTPLTTETMGIINNDFLNKMNKGSSLVNTARGALFHNLDDLYIKLKEDYLYCLAIDVLKEEPPINSNLINDWRESKDWLEGRLIINPHTSYYSNSSFKELRINAAMNAKRILLNKGIKNIL